MTFLQITNQVQTEYSSSNDVSDHTSINIPSDINLALYAGTNNILHFSQAQEAKFTTELHPVILITDMASLCV